MTRDIFISCCSLVRRDGWSDVRSPADKFTRDAGDAET